MRSDLFQRSKTSPRPYVWLRRLSMLAVLSGSEGVGVVFFSSLMFLRSDNRQRSSPLNATQTQGSSTFRRLNLLPQARARVIGTVEQIMPSGLDKQRSSTLSAAVDSLLYRLCVVIADSFPSAYHSPGIRSPRGLAFPNMTDLPVMDLSYARARAITPISAEEY